MVLAAAAAAWFLTAGTAVGFGPHGHNKTCDTPARWQHGVVYDGPSAPYTQADTPEECCR